VAINNGVAVFHSVLIAKSGAALGRNVGSPLYWV
jgi:hypothetical protein